MSWMIECIWSNTTNSVCDGINAKYRREKTKYTGYVMAMTVLGSDGLDVDC